MLRLTYPCGEFRSVNLVFSVTYRKELEEFETENWKREDCKVPDLMVMKASC